MKPVKNESNVEGQKKAQFKVENANTPREIGTSFVCNPKWADV